MRLIVRFDDPNRKRFNRNPLKLPVSLMKGKTRKVLDVKQVGDELVLAPGTSPTGAGPQQMGVSADLLTQVIEGIIPIRASLGRNGIRTASTLQLEIAFADLPLDPRMVRGCAVEFYLGTVTASEFGRGIAGETRDGPGGVEPLHVIPETYADGFGRPRTNLRFQGWVDDWEEAWSESGATLRLNCRDNTTLLLDTEAPPLLTVNPKVPITQAFADYLAAFPQFAGLRVKYLPKTDPSNIPIYAKVLQKSAYKPHLGPAAGNVGSVWDYFTDLAGAIGHTVRFDGATIIVQRSRALYSNRYPSREEDPFQGRALPGGRALPFRLFVWGRNVKDLQMKRKYTVAGPTTIEVRCYSTTLKRTLVVRYPLKKDRLERGLPGSLLPDEKIQVFNLQGIKDEASLRIAAQEVYEQLGRNELEVMLKTNNLGSYGGSALDPDLLDCKAGDTITLEVTRDEDTAELTTPAGVQRKTTVQQEASQYVRGKGFSPDFAAAYAKAVGTRTLQPNFRVKRLQFDWDIEKGIDITLVAINYLEVRGDNLPATEEPDFTESPEEARDRRLREAKNFGIIGLLKGGGAT